jgi:tRNA threonylcarbamoyl adenosine modification protein YeaZ
VLAQAEALALIVCGTGPGSCTGIRVGIAAATGLALARGVPVIGLCSLSALAHTDGLERFAVCGDARRGAWWWLEAETGRALPAPAVAPHGEVAARAAAWSGQIFTTDAAPPPFCQATVTHPRAERLASAASGLSDDDIARMAAQPLEPLYLSAPFVTVSRQPVFL